MKTSGIYIHVPFCKAKCIYCDFYSVAGQDERIDDYVNALIEEIRFIDIDPSNWKFDTIFIGGGTPSLLSAKQLESIITALRKRFDLTNIAEFTIEANPGEAPMSKLKDFLSLGVNRLSIGVQSYDTELLKFLSRVHSSDESIITFTNAREAGFENINCDLIYNIPSQSLVDWKKDLKKLIEMNPEHISAYSLTVENGTKLHELVSANEINMPADEIHVNFNNTANELLSKNGYSKYEISNYSRPNKECRHNLHYWQHDSYLGFGTSAHSFDGNRRWNNFSNINKYITELNRGSLPIENNEILSEIDKINEIIGFGLRMTEGVDLKLIPNNYFKGIKNNLHQVQKKYPDMIFTDNSRIKLTQKGMYFADAIAAEMLFDQ